MGSSDAKVCLSPGHISGFTSSVALTYQIDMVSDRSSLLHRLVSMYGKKLSTMRIQPFQILRTA